MSTSKNITFTAVVKNSAESNMRAIESARRDISFLGSNSSLIKNSDINEIVLGRQDRQCFEDRLHILVKFIG